MEVNKVRKLLEANEIESMLFISKQNRYWYSGYLSSSGYLLVTKEESYFFVDGRYIEDIQDKTKNVVIIQVENVLDDIANFVKKLKIKSIGFEKEYMTIDFLEMLESKLTKIFKPISVRHLRMVKNKEEIAFLKKAAEITDEIFIHALKNFKIGMRENDLENIIHNSFVKFGADKIFPRVILNSGRKGSLPHGKPSDKVILNEEFITIDFGAVYKGYYADMTRTIVVGKSSKKLEDIYKIVKEAQLVGINMVKPGIKACEIHQAVFEHIKNAGFGKNFVHQTGHGIGLEVHEPPRIANYDNTILEEGMVFTIEPGIYVPNLGGVRIEDVVLVTVDGAEVLTKLTKELVSI